MFAEDVQVNPWIKIYQSNDKQNSQKRSYLEKKPCKNHAKEVLKRLACEAPIVIDKLPCILTKSGNYCIGCDLSYNGPSGTSAITVAAGPVLIHGNHHKISLQNPSTNGISVSGQNLIDVENLAIHYPVRATSQDTGIAVNIVNAQLVNLDKILVDNAYRAFFVEDSSDVSLNNSRSYNSVRRDLQSNDSNDLYLNNCSFENALGDAPEGIAVFGGSGLNFANLSLVNKGVTLAFGSNAIIENMNLLFDTFPTGAGSIVTLQLGNDPFSGQVWDGLVLRDSNIAVKFADDQRVNDAIPVLLQVADNVLVQNTHISNNAITLGGFLTFLPIATVGFPTFASGHNVKFVNCQLRGSRESIDVNNPSFIGLFIAGESESNPTTNVSIENCQLQDTTDAAILFNNVFGSVIKDSNISNNLGDGISLLIGSQHNALLNNVLARNGGTGIVLKNIGVFGEPGNNPLANHIQGNMVFGNTSNGIDNTFGVNTETYFNTSCNNGGINAINVSPVQAPGDPAVAGSNIVCNQIM